MARILTRFSSSVLGVAAASLALSGAHLEMASGNDLGPFGGGRGDAALIAPGAAPEINRAAKGDRDIVTAPSRQLLRTVSIQVDQLAHTSVLIRVPADHVRGDNTPAPAARPTKPSARKMIACEPLVSGLTEVAKILDSGRCIT